MSKFIDQYLLLAALVVFGATAHALTQLSVARREKIAFDLLDFVIALVVAAFSGTLFGIVAASWWTDLAVVYGVAGVGAFLGLKGLNVLADAILTLLATKAKTKLEGKEEEGDDRQE